MGTAFFCWRQVLTRKKNVCDKVTLVLFHQMQQLYECNAKSAECSFKGIKRKVKLSYSIGISLRNSR